MNDDTKVLVKWLQSGVSESSAGRMYKRALDTIESLERDCAALAERCEKLREALAQIGDLCEFTLVRRDFVYGIGQIEGAVQEALAAPKDAP